MIIKNEQFLLVLDYESQSKTHYVALSESNGTTLAGWGPHTRVSPVWPLVLDDGEGRDRTGLPEACNTVAFVATSSPSSIFADLGESTFFEGSGNFDAWVSLGSFSLIILMEPSAPLDSLIDYCATKNLACEVWTLSDAQGAPHGARREISDMAFHPVASEPKPDFSALHAEIDSTQEHFKPTLIELAALLSMSAARTANQLPSLKSDISSLGEIALKFLTDPPALRRGSTESEAHKSRILSGIHNINAGLSRLTSQALSGSMPISKTECHFWPHSLLGIGVANLALRNTVGFITDVFEQFGFSERLDRLLENSAVVQERSMGVRFRDISLHNHLDNVPPTEARPAFLPITYFSGRDGFKNSDFTTSAPLMSIQAGNSVTYSMVTISHEVSHRVVSSLISKVVGEDIDALPTFRQFEASLSRSPSDNRQLFLDIFCAVLIELAGGQESVSSGMEDFEDSSEFMALLFHEHHEDIEEHLVHIFDFWYFFNRDVQMYVRSIWRSWAIIPDISSRLKEYTVRTLVAISSNNVGTDGWLDKSRDELIAVFRETSMKEALHLAEDVLELLEDDGEFEEIEEQVQCRIGVLKLFHIFLKSQVLARELREDQLIGGSALRRQRRSARTPASDYGFQPRTMVPTKFENPIRFLNQYTTDEVAESSKSAWLLYMLAGNIAKRGAV